MIDKRLFENYDFEDFSDFEIKNFWDWLINFSYILTLKNWKKFFLQKINTSVFPDIEALENNFSVLEKAKKEKNIKILLPFKNKQNKFFTEFEWEFFRIFLFLDDSLCFNVVENNNYILEAAKSFSSLSLSLSEYFSEFKDTIKNFHNLEFRFENFKKTLEKNIFPERTENSKDLIDFILENEKIVEKSKYFMEKIPKRVFHHDAKINNVLFEKENFFVKYIIDLDTFMAWYIFSDFWDLVWTLVFWIDHQNPKKTEFNKEKYNLLVKWYLEWFNSEISETEIEAMHFWWIYISFMLSIRFLDDYLNGDKYFKITYADQNFLRAKYQLEIVKDLQKFLEE